jgi:hypothetical protein
VNHYLRFSASLREPIYRFGELNDRAGESTYDTIFEVL